MTDHETIHSTPAPGPLHRPVEVRESGLPYISWGAIFAGLVIVLSLSWLLHLLGAAMGVSIADATDSVTMEGGLTVGTTLWVVLSWMIAFFIGSMATARLAGKIDDFSGMLHGFTLWGIGTLAAVVIGSWGISSILQTGQQIASSAAQGVAVAGSGMATGVGYAAEGSYAATQQITNQFGGRIQERLTDRAAEIASSADTQLSEQEIRNVINDLDERTLRRVVQDLTNDDQEGAAQLLADSTDLSEQDAEALIDSAYQEMEQQFGNPENDQPLSQDLQNNMASAVDSYVASLDARGGAEVSEQDIRRAVASLDAQAVQAMASRLANGNTDGAKRVLVQNTNLTSEQIDELYEGAMEGIDEEAEEYVQAVNQVAESVSSYTAQVLWIVFAGTALGLAVALAGGWLGADTSRTVYAQAYNR
ncbi:hypothetical protein [Rubinisphaera sp. JC750]|uniref:hypothetical protein n=1 Tax=Rubinisphaera sp. JC750 TaxID=2898658 RepID=UPI001F3A2F31|nr:hypothetical protein [Rubinisphaera sp. JC750]